MKTLIMTICVIILEFSWFVSGVSRADSVRESVVVDTVVDTVVRVRNRNCGPQSQPQPQPQVKILDGNCGTAILAAILEKLWQNYGILEKIKVFFSKFYFSTITKIFNKWKIYDFFIINQKWTLFTKSFLG